MFKSISGLCVALGAASVAHAGAVVDLVPRLGLDATFAPGEVVTMDLFLTQDPAGLPRGLRLVQFDFSDTGPALVVEDQITFNVSLVRRGFARYFQDRNQIGTPRTVVLAYVGTDYPNENKHDPDFEVPDEDLLPWWDSMIVLPESGTIRIGDIDVTMPTTLGVYQFDVVNSDEPDPNHGAALSFGFGLNQSDPVTVWRAFSGRGIGSDLLGGANVFVPDGVNFRWGFPEPATLGLLAIGGIATAVFRRRRVA